MYAFLQELFRVGLYKRTQGRAARQVTFAAVAVIVTAGIWRLYGMLGTGLESWPGSWIGYWNRLEFFTIGRSETMEAVLRQSLHYGLPFMLLLAGWWAVYRLVNYPVFADFLIAVEAEMNKVSWPTRGELYRSSIVVLVTIFALAAVLFGFDLVWRRVFDWLEIL